MARSSPIRRRLAVAFALLAPLAAGALGPHEIALIVNTNSARSLTVANHYAHWRSVPVQNIIGVGLAPEPDTSCSISRGEFEQAIWKPVNAELARRGLAGHVIAWIYSVDFPAAIRMDPMVSLQGLTHLRNRTPTSNEVVTAAYGSPLFRGPAKENGPEGPPLTLEQFAATLGTNFPLPTMSLGHCAPRGMTEDEVLANLKLSCRSDGTLPNGAINFILGDDVRVRCRAWQVAGAQRELTSMGVKTVVTTGRAERTSFLMGLQMGAQRVEGFADEVKLQPGSMAEHLTSFGATFSTDDQSKITQWLKAGAAASAGTVTEPFALWPKFPHARFFVHYAAGCTMLEAFSQGLANPLQVLVLGDPLARPYGATAPLTLICMNDQDDALKGDAEFVLMNEQNKPLRAPGVRVLYQLDGQPLPLPPTASSITLDTGNLADGWHELRAVAYAPGNIRIQGFATKRFGVANRCAAPETVARDGVDLACSVAWSDTVSNISWRVDGREVASGTGANALIRRALTGWGPVQVQAVITGGAGQTIRARPAFVTLSKPAQ